MVTAVFQSTVSSRSSPAWNSWHSVGPTPEFVVQCIELQRRILKVYLALCGSYTRHEQVHALLDHLVHQKQEQIALLELCREVACRALGRTSCLDAAHVALTETGQRLKEAVATLCRRHGVADVLRLVLEIELPLARLLLTVVEATEPRLNLDLQTLRGLGDLCRRIPLLNPDFSDACREIQAQIAKVNKSGWY